MESKCVHKKPLGILVFSALLWSPIAYAQTCAIDGPVTQTRSIKCPSEQEGTIIQESSFLCPEEIWTDWYALSNTCGQNQKRQAQTKKCIRNKKTRRSRCPSGQNGHIIQQSDFKCPSAQWGPWYETLNQCKKCSRNRKTRKTRCPSGQNGNIFQASDFKCPMAQWGPWYETSRNCKK